MSLLSNAVNIVISVFLMMSLGFVGSKLGWFKADAQKLFSFLIVRIALPCMILAKITTAYTRETLLQGAYGLIVPFLSMIALYLVANALVHLLRIPKGRQGVFVAMIVFSNSVFVGVPIAKALFGDVVIPHTLLYYVANTVFFWTVGVRAIQQDKQGKLPIFSKNTLKSLASPPMIAFAVSVLVVLIGFSLPKAILDACDYIGTIVTPLSMFFIGTVLATIKPKDIRLDRGLVAVILGRFVLSPLFIYCLTMVFVVPTITRDAFLVQAAMPVMTQVSILAAVQESDVEYATLGVTVTTLLSLLVIPGLALLLPYL